MAADASGAFLAYHEPDIISILTLISFFLFLAIAEWLADQAIRAPLIGQIIVGVIYGVPVANVLASDWQETFLALGYIGLILIILEGGLTVRLDLLGQNILLSIIAALLGVLTPIALSFALLYAGFHHTALEAFIVGTALCSTSLGTTFVVLSSASRASPKSQTQASDGNVISSNNIPTHSDASAAVDFSQTRIGTVLVSAAVLDDVCGLVLVSVIHNLRGITGDGDGDGDGGASSGNLGWIVGRPVLASVLMAVLTPAVARFVARPGYRRFVEPRVVAAGVGHVVNILLMAVVVGGFLAVAAYAGASVLFGAFLAGAFLSALPSPGAKGGVGFMETFEKYLGGPQRFVFQPLFFASIGFAIPFLELWKGEVVWKGILYTLLMAIGKLIVGVTVPAWDFISSHTRRKSFLVGTPAADTGTWASAMLLGAAMVARGEIGLLIIQIGLNETPFLSRKAFVIGVWAIVLNTIIGPVLVGLMISRVGARIATDPRWGVQAKKGSETDGDAGAEERPAPGQVRA